MNYYKHFKEFDCSLWLEFLGKAAIVTGYFLINIPFSLAVRFIFHR
jgi:hypothetical protein